MPWSRIIFQRDIIQRRMLSSIGDWDLLLSLCWSGFTNFKSMMLVCSRAVDRGWRIGIVEGVRKVWTAWSWCMVQLLISSYIDKCPNKRLSCNVPSVRSSFRTFMPPLLLEIELEVRGRIVKISLFPASGVQRQFANLYLNQACLEWRPLICDHTSVIGNIATQFCLRKPCHLIIVENDGRLTNPAPCNHVETLAQSTIM
jgi:hypothetical protein